MKRSLFLLLAVVASGLLVGSASAQSPSDYIMVRLLFEGHDQPNFDLWHAEPTAAALAKAAGVPDRYVTRTLDWHPPGYQAPSPAAAKPGKPAPAQTATPVPVGDVSLITDGAAEAPQATSNDKAAKTDGSAKPESGASDLAAGSQQQPAAAEPTARESQLLQQLSQLVRGKPAAEQGDAQQGDGSSAERRRRGTRVFVLGGRRLLANPNQAEAYFAIKTNASEPWAVRDVVKRKLMATSAGFGMADGMGVKGLYTLLKENGVTYYPAVWVDGTQVLSGPPSLDAPHNRFINATSKDGKFQHKLFSPSDLVAQKKANATNVTVAEPAFVMANRSTVAFGTTHDYSAPTQRRGLPGWATALIVLGVIAAAVAMGASVWRCIKQRRARMEEAEEAEEPLSPQSVQSHETA